MLNLRGCIAIDCKTELTKAGVSEHVTEHVGALNKKKLVINLLLAIELLLTRCAA